MYENDLKSKTDFEHSFNLESDIQRMYKREKFTYYVKIIIPNDIFIVSCKNQFRFSELKKYKCPIRVLDLILDSQNYKITNLDNVSMKVDYELNYIDAYEKFNDETLLILMDSADKYIESSSFYLDKYGSIL